MGNIEAIAAGLLLTVTMVFVHGWTRQSTLDWPKPLLEDAKLPPVWAGHASSVFSLTALFSAYFAIIFLFGATAVIGTACGSVMALFLIRRVVRRWGPSEKRGFHEFLLSRNFSRDRFENRILWGIVTVTQLGFAASELVILREIGIQGFNFAPRHADVLALSVALVGYFYCLLGGYIAIFRTDLAQLGLVILMALGLGMSLLESGLLDLELRGARATTDLWTLGFAGNSIAAKGIRATIGFVMGMGFLLASPDTWKRVCAAEIKATRSRVQFVLLVVAGFLPFALILPLILVSQPASGDSLIDPISLIFSVAMGPWLLALILVGMASSFLSSFDSALMAGAHSWLRGPMKSAKGTPQEKYFLTLASVFLVTASLAAVATVLAENPYLLATFLLPAYAILAGLFLGTGGLEKPVPWPGVALLAVGVLALWPVYAYERVANLTLRPTVEQVDLAPIGVLVCGGFWILARTLRLLRRKEHAQNC